MNRAESASNARESHQTQDDTRISNVVATSTEHVITIDNNSATKIDVAGGPNTIKTKIIPDTLGHGHGHR